MRSLRITYSLVTMALLGLSSSLVFASDDEDKPEILSSPFHHSAASPTATPTLSGDEGSPTPYGRSPDSSCSGSPSVSPSPSLEALKLTPALGSKERATVRPLKLKEEETDPLSASNHEQIDLKGKDVDSKPLDAKGILDILRSSSPRASVEACKNFLNDPRISSAHNIKTVVRFEPPRVYPYGYIGGGP